MSSSLSITVERNESDGYQADILPEIVDDGKNHTYNFLAALMQGNHTRSKILRLILTLFPMAHFAGNSSAPDCSNISLGKGFHFLEGLGKSLIILKLNSIFPLCVLKVQKWVECGNNVPKKFFPKCEVGC